MPHPDGFDEFIRRSGAEGGLNRVTGHVDPVEGSRDRTLYYEVEF